MNIVKILLVLGLGYVAMTQKSEKTKNMLLVVTGLLAFCMFSVEGFGVVVPTCTEATESNSVEADAAACADVRGEALNTADACNAVLTASSEDNAATQACTYTASPAPRDLQVSDLSLLFPSCTGGKVVKSTPPADLSGELCETATSSRINYSDFCGPDATCDGGPTILGGVPANDDGSNVCNENFASYQSTCKCNDDTKTWSNGECTAPQAPQ